MNRILDTFEDVTQHKKVLLLYSGGVDSSYALFRLLKSDVEVIAYRANNGHGFASPEMRKFLSDKNVRLIEEDCAQELTADFISKGILAGGYYQGRFPISSSYTRPLIAKRAVKAAQANGCSCIVHTSNFHQNSAARFNNGVLAHSANIMIGIPYIKSDISRAEKLRALTEHGYQIDGSLYSIDENLWCRVIENGDLDDLKTSVADRHFKWTVHGEIPEQTLISLSFREGLPCAINGHEMDLLSLIKDLNALGGEYQIGRFNGLEDTPSGIKNHEVREAPAAEIIHTGKQLLESAVLTQSELELLAQLDERWTRLVVHGGWYSLEKESIEIAITRLNSIVNGNVKISLKPNSAFACAIDSPFALDFHSLENDIAAAKAGFSYSADYHIRSVAERSRANAKSLDL